jgi:DNA mismatch repair protein MutL
VISRALAEGFRGALNEGLHPAAWLWLDLEPTLVDVNVHPAKREVRFHRPLDVRDAILEAVKAAKERILYENLLRQRDGGPTQGLLVPVLLELDPRDLDLLLRERISLADAGIEVEAFGGNTVQVRTLPGCLDIDDPRPFLGEMLDELLHEPVSGARFAIERLARMLAKRAAALVQPRLIEARPLLVELFACDLPYCTADGRPTLTEFGMRELERRFGIQRS